jgi:hypothetical protein
MSSTTQRSTIGPRRVFGRGSPVLDYWLGHSQGFELSSPRGGHRGVVEDVVLDERGRPRALVVRGGALQRTRVLDVGAVEGVIPATETITLRSERLARPAPREPRTTAAPLGRATVRGAAATGTALGLLARMAWAVLVLAWSLGRRGVRGVRRRAPVVTRRVGRTAAAAASWAGPHARRLVRLGGAAAVTFLLFLGALARALVVGIVASASLVAQEWRRQRPGTRRDRMSTARR